MRTEENWIKRIRPEKIKQFSPRLQRDLQLYPYTKGLPNIENLFIHGRVGSGKTLLSVHLILEQERQLYLNYENKTCEFESVPELFEEIKKSYDKIGKSEHEILDHYSELDLLVLDDLGLEKPTDWVLSILYLIINRRYESLKPTVITSNVGLKDIAEKLGDDRVTHRIEREYKIIKLDKTYK
jgi:DNA replication protein DnaC